MRESETGELVMSSYMGVGSAMRTGAGRGETRSAQRTLRD